MIRIALDSNILAYLAGVSRTAADDDKVRSVRDTIKRLSAFASLVAPAQTLGELFVVLRRSGASAAEAKDILRAFAAGFGTAATDVQTALAATQLVVDHKLQFWDSLIIAAAANVGCTILLSEDMQDGFVVQGITITNPLAKPPHPNLVSLLQLQA